jgi:hypothetical protein
MASTDVEGKIDEFIARTRKMTGTEVREREPWNSEASADAIRHYAYGTDDGNPLCLQLRRLFWCRSFIRSFTEHPWTCLSPH